MPVLGWRYGPVHDFMLWNLFLAIVPAVLALLLFRSARSRGVAWWCGLGAWLLFLPNAPYVLTDVMHMVDDVQRAPNRMRAYVVLVTYGVFFAVGLASYVLSLQMFRTFLHRVGTGWMVAPAILAVHGACIVGMYLGRFVRLNSWDAVLEPGSVLESVAHVPRPFTVVVLVVMFLVVGAGAYATKAIGDKMLAEVRRFR